MRMRAVSALAMHTGMVITVGWTKVKKTSEPLLCKMIAVSLQGTTAGMLCLYMIRCVKTKNRILNESTSSEEVEAEHTAKEIR